MSWQSQIIELLTASLIRPVVLAAAAWLLLHLYKVRHPASCHAVWAAVLIGMMVLPLVSVIAPQWKLPLLPKKPEPVTRMQVQQSDDLTDSESSDVRLNSVTSAQPQIARFAWPATQTLIVWCYFVGVFVMVIFRLTGWALLWRVMSKSRLLRPRLLESGEVITPVTVGVLRPSVILPAGWRNWNTNTKRAVLAHEFAHIRRRDTLTSSLSRLAKCIFWFHPLAWWISQQLSELAELSCDAAALEKNGDPGGCSRILLGFAETVSATGYRTALPGLAIASRSGMSHRIDQVFELAGGNLRRLSRPGTVLTLMGLPVMCLAAVVGLTAPPSRVLRHATSTIVPPQPVVLAQLQSPTAAPVQSTQPVPDSKPKFDVASIKQCAPTEGGGGRSAGNTGPMALGGGSISPGRISIKCVNVEYLIIQAYVRNANNPLVNDFGVLVPDSDNSQRIRGGPSWAHSDRYSIEAETDNPVANGPTGGTTPATVMMMGPMLQSLLEDRFQLKTHREVGETPVYSLTVAKDGLKIKPMEEGSCVPHEAGTGLPTPVPGGKPWCVNGMGTRGPNQTFDAAGSSMDRVARTLSSLLMDRPVVDKTAIPGLFSFHVEFGRDENMRRGPSPPPGMNPPPAEASDLSPGPSIFTVFEQQLGLKLVPDKGPRGYIVIDHVERPSEN